MRRSLVGLRCCTRGLLEVLALAGLLAAGAGEAQACSCEPGSTLTSSFEAAKWVVLADLEAVESRGVDEGNLALVNVREQFKGPPVESLTLKARYLSSCDIALAQGDTWLLFLAARHDALGKPQWPGMCGGSLPVEAERRVDSERVATVLAVLRSREPEADEPPPDPWRFEQRPGGLCVLGKPFSGPAAAGGLFVRSVAGELTVAVQFHPIRRPAFPPVDDPRDLRVDVGGEFHEVNRHKMWPRQRQFYQLEHSPAEFLVSRLITLDPPWLRLSLGGEFETEVGVFGLQPAAEKFTACREREHASRAGWLEVEAMPARDRDTPMGFSWSVAATQAPAKPIIRDRPAWGWEELTAGEYLLTTRCYGEERSQRIRIVEGEVERVTIRCGS